MSSNSAKSSKLSKPLLPQSFLQKLKADTSTAISVTQKGSFSYTPEGHEVRMKMRNWQRPWSPDAVELDDPPHFLGGGNMWHYMVSSGDVIAVAEFLYFGATPDLEDPTDGATPLWVVSKEIANITEHQNGPFIDIVKSLTELTPVRMTKENVLRRLGWIVRMLVEQHADVHKTANDLSILQLAYNAQRWDHIVLLIKHGARPSRDFHFASSADERRISSLVEINRNSPRPPRICPCWSGKTIGDCHATLLPYPLKYLCVCGSGKTYERCCHSKNAVVLEQWDPIRNRVKHDYEAQLNNPHRQARERMDATALMVQQMLAKSEGVDADHASVVLPLTAELDIQRRAEANRTVLEELSSRGVLDPAFAYVWRKAGFCPQPVARKFSKVICEDQQKRWNDIVDEYIASGQDSRTGREIERAAKIGPWNGALWRSCEGPGCTVIEDDSLTLKRCTRCKIAVYCSTDCQQSAWKHQHKTQCSDAIEQRLPSQEAIARYFREGGHIASLTPAMRAVFAKFMEETNFLYEMMRPSLPTPSTR
ncbi:uncharacterized protein STEHIDRAFT_141805, partial [Stereum hirsutum FP-91666 SS1]|uniref:uncharacterized protein n=1 Tax=Stereum hirsutum (strain FP-91666) TaxID=721885 RepID=UPI0004449BDF